MTIRNTAVEAAVVSWRANALFRLAGAVMAFFAFRASAVDWWAPVGNLHVVAQAFFAGFLGRASLLRLTEVDYRTIARRDGLALRIAEAIFTRALFVALARAVATFSLAAGAVRLCPAFPLGETADTIFVGTILVAVAIIGGTGLVTIIAVVFATATIVNVLAAMAFTGLVLRRLLALGYTGSPGIRA